jgi:hypothetical protein
MDETSSPSAAEGDEPPVAVEAPEQSSLAAQLMHVLVDGFQASTSLPPGPAHSVALARAAAFARSLADRLCAENASADGLLADPGFLYAAQAALVEHSQAGDPLLAGVLVELLIDRAASQPRSMRQLVIEDALTTAPRLTEAQLAGLTLAFLLRYAQHDELVDHLSLGDYFDRYLHPLLDHFPPLPADLQRLQLVGCGTFDAEEVALEAILADVYQGLFVSGLTKDDILVRQMLIEPTDRRFFRSSLLNPTRWQVRARNQQQLIRLCAEHRVSARDREQLLELMRQSALTPAEVRRWCLSLRPYLEPVFEAWDASPLCRLALTPAGIAIARANAARLTGAFADLRIWV